MELIKTFKFAANLEYVNEYLTKKKVEHEVNFETNSLLCKEVDKAKILKILNDLELDEEDVEVDEYLLKGYEEWDKNMYNPYYFTGGKVPFFYWQKKNFPIIILTFFLAPLLTMLILFLKNGVESFSFSNILIFIFYSAIIVSMYLQWLNDKKKNS